MECLGESEHLLLLSLHELGKLILIHIFLLDCDLWYGNRRGVGGGMCDGGSTRSSCSIGSSGNVPASCRLDVLQYIRILRMVVGFDDTKSGSYLLSELLVQTAEVRLTLFTRRDPTFVH